LCFRTDRTMVMLKLSSLLVAYVLVSCQMYSSHAAPARTGLESMTDGVTLNDYEARRLLNAIVKEFVQVTSEELQQQTNEVNRPMSKRCSNLSTCVLGKLSQELHKLQTYPRTNTGSGTPGKKRSLSNSNRYSYYEDSYDEI
uniref:Calcitonin peptide-like domain-containing protein n=1 Tax=Esox lucius TaxID=8010 RepID=A0A3P8ZFY7_ESOLU